MGLILFSGLPLPRHLLTHIQAPARVTRPTASQPGESRCLFSASPRENSLPAVACPIRSTPLLCLEGVPDLPVAPQDEAGLTKTFQTRPRGWFHIP